MVTPRFLQFRELVWKNFPQVVRDIQLSWKTINFNQDEPYIILDYLSKGLKYLNNNIARSLSRQGFIVKFAGVFVHSKPMVKGESNCSKGRKYCELGDLLVLFIMLDRHKKIIHQRAFISQAKRKNKMDNKCQFCLYEIDKRFKYVRGACDYNGQIRNLPYVYLRHLGMNYLILNDFIDLECWLWYPYIRRCSGPYIKRLPFSAEIKIPWGFSITTMLMQSYGLQFSKKEPNDLGWSRIIWDLINCTGEAVFGKQKRPRGYYLKLFLRSFNQYDKYEEYFLKGKEEEGIPILFIIVQDTESEI